MASVLSHVRRVLPPAGKLPLPRGPVTERLLASLRDRPHHLSWKLSAPEASDEDDLHLALYCCYELHYHGFLGVDADWEWEPDLLAVRRQLEAQFLADLGVPDASIHPDITTVIARLSEIATDNDGPSLSAWVADRATLDQVRELAIHRSAYQLKEADPHTWAIPRLAGQAKAAMVAIQADEYGNGIAARMHATLFARTMEALGLDPATSYLDLIPGVTLATTNLISLLGLHRRWRGALVGHLALFEMSSVGPMARYGTAFRRLGVPQAGWQFYDAHVDADDLHRHVATDGMVTGLLLHEPDLARDVLFGAEALDAVEARFSRFVLNRWDEGRSSLRGEPDLRAGTSSAERFDVSIS